MPHTKVKIICTVDLIFVTNQVFILGLKWLKEYCFYNDCNKQNKQARYMHVLYFTHVCHDMLYVVTHMCFTVTHMYTHGLMPHVVFCLCLCVMCVGCMLHACDMHGPFKVWVICTVKSVRVK